MSGKGICMLKRRVGEVCLFPWFSLISFYIIPMCSDPWFVFGNISPVFTEESDFPICSPATLYAVFRSDSEIIACNLIAVGFYDLMWCLRQCIWIHNEQWLKVLLPVWLFASALEAPCKPDEEKVGKPFQFRREISLDSMSVWEIFPLFHAT